VAAERLDVARAQLEGLDEELGKTTVAEWDAPVVADVVRALLDCTQKLERQKGKSAPELGERVRQLFDRLARLDPAAALKGSV
jgi:hypothetical protein